MFIVYLFYDMDVVKMLRRSMSVHFRATLTQTKYEIRYRLLDFNAWYLLKINNNMF